jgi:hypothetical protein
MLALCNAYSDPSIGSTYMSPLQQHEYLLPLLTVYEVGPIVRPHW